MASVRLRYRHAAEVEARAASQAKERAVARTRLVAAPPATELLGSWRVIEMKLTSKGSVTSHDHSLDERILFEAVRRDRQVVGRWICRNMRMSLLGVRGPLMYAEAEYALGVHANVEERSLQGDKNPLPAPTRLGPLMVVTLIPEVLRARWRGHRMAGSCSTSYGDRKTFRAVRVDEEEE